MQTFTTTLLDEEMIFESYASVNLFESFADYAVRQLLPVYAADATLTQTYCVVSGFPVGHLNQDEIEAMIRSAIYANRIDERLGGVKAPSDSDTAAAFEIILDHIAARIISTSRVAPSLAFSSNRLSIGNAHWTRQLSVLLGTLLFDAGEMRDKSPTFTDKMNRIYATIDLASYVRQLSESQLTTDLHAALVELDAKYAIRQLKFTSNEKARLIALKDAGVPTLDAVLEFVIQLTRYRDETFTEIQDGTLLWTKEVFRERTFDLADRESYSNVVTLDPVRKPKPESNGKRGRPIKPENVAKRADKASRDAAKQAMANQFLGIFDSVMGDGFVQEKK